MTGRVVGQAGNPAPGVPVSLFQADVRSRAFDAPVQAREVASVQTDANGQFSIPGVAPGDYNLFAEESADSKAAQSVQVSGQTTDLGNLLLQPTGTVTGRVLVVGRSAFAG
ncbi:MAG: carboxypeptidase regulatory-like domain-containing protein [Candidatus Eremiobacterota bacterium]